ncbi:MAG TPA: type II secretion system F family protein [Candidatus Paceibacterota bacterium]|nr:type II secretion system F family protein [Candidatus Paceibacterota bacterium]
MTKFSYTAEKSGGEVYRASAEAQDRFALYDIVRREGGKILSLEEESGGGRWNVARWNLLLARVKEYDKILFARNLGAMLSAGLALARALAVMERQSANPKLARIMSDLAGDVRRGTTLHEALGKARGVFSPLFIAMVKSGEESGDLPGTLTTLAEQMERVYEIKKKIRGALIYPCIILIAIVGIGFLMMTQVVPTLAQTFAEMHANLPYSTQVVIGISNFLVNNTILALGLVVFVIFGIYLALKTAPARRALDWTLLHTPVIGGLVREVNAARTARTLSSLLASGVDVITALSITAEVLQNSYFRDVIEAAKTGVGSGQPLSSAFVRNERLYPAFVGEMMSVGEETGETNDMLKRLAIFYETEVDRKTKDMSTIIEPFLMLVIGGAVGFFAVSMIGPIYSLSSAIS